MLSKVFKTSFCGLFKAQSITISKAFGFCTVIGQMQESHPLRNKIMGLSTFEDFNNFFKDKKQQFDVSCYSMASRTLAKILIESRMTLSYDHKQSIKNYLSNLQKVEIDQMNLQQFSQVLYLLRILKLDLQNSNTFVNIFVKTILERGESKLKEIEAETNVNRLCYFYQEYSSLGSRKSGRIANKINQFLKTNNSDVEFQDLTVNEINLVLKGMRTRKQISIDETNLLKNIVRTVVEKYFDILSLFELVQISVSINEINSRSFNDILPSYLISQIHKKILTNIDELDEKSIMYILNGQNTGNRTYQSIYKVIFDKILDEIQPNGESSFNELFTLRLFSGMSNKVRLHLTTSENQQKFFAFFKQTLTKSPRFINSFLQNFIQGSFLSNKNLLKIVEILESIPDFNYKLIILYKMSKKKQNISKLSKIDTNKEIEIKGESLIMMITIVENLISFSKDPAAKTQLEEFLGKLKKRFFHLYMVEDDSFTRLVGSLNPELLETLYKNLRVELEEKFPNPMETKQTEKYRASWLRLLVLGNNQNMFTKKHSHIIREKLTQNDLLKLIKTTISRGYENTDTISNIMNLALKRFDLVQENNDILTELSRLMSQEMKQIFENGSSEMIRSRYWHMINECFEKIEPKNFFSNFMPIISTIIKSGIYEFKYSAQYRSFLTKIFSKAQFIHSKNIALELLDENLKLNLIRRSDIPNLNDYIKNNLSENQKLILKMIETNQFQLKDVQVTKENLHMFLYNLSPQTLIFVENNNQKIQNLISEMSVQDVWRCIIHFRLGSRKQGAQIIQSLFKQINSYKVNFEKCSPIYACQVLKRNNYDKFISIKMENIKLFLQKALENFSDWRNTSKITLEDHCELIKAVIDFKIKNEEYFHALFNHYQYDNNIFKRELYLLAGNLGITLNNKEIYRLIEQNFFVGFNSSFSKCFTIFILFMKDLPDPDKHLTTLINKYNELKQKQKVPVYQLFYDYLRKKFPEETKNWQPNYFQQADFCRSIESINSRTFNLLREASEEMDKVKWTENLVAGNNYYYTFRNITLLFPYESKYCGTNLMLKQVVGQLIGSDKILTMDRRQHSAKSIISYIQHNYQVFNSTEITDLLKKIDQRNTADSNKNSHEEEAEESPEAEKTKTDA